MANIFGFVVQWGTSGPAIYVTYYSPPAVSFTLLFQNLEALITWTGFRVYLWRFAHICRRCHLIVVVVDFGQPTLAYGSPSLSTLPPRISLPTISGHYRRTRFHTFLCGTAVITRVLGKSIAVINACWILAWSFLTYTNIMETPYCTTAYFSLRSLGWMRLWNFDPQQFTPTKVEELRCLVFGLFIAYFACVLIFALTSDGKTRRYRWTVIAALSLGFFILVLPLYFYGVKSIQKVS
jgi:hypothetical protein